MNSSVISTLNCPKAQIEIITRTQPDGVELLRHDAAHVMAQAVKELYPETQVTIGPVIENGFYYDFVDEESPSLLMIWSGLKADARVSERRYLYSKRSLGARCSDRFFEEQGETYKAQIIRDLQKMR